MRTIVRTKAHAAQGKTRLEFFPAFRFANYLSLRAILADCQTNPFQRPVDTICGALKREIIRPGVRRLASKGIDVSATQMELVC